MDWSFLTEPATGGVIVGLFGSAVAYTIKGWEKEKQHRRDIESAAKIDSYVDIRVEQEKSERAAVENSTPLVNNIHRLFRPLLTVTCIFCAVACEFAGLTNATSTFTGLSATTVTWWFSDLSIDQVGRIIR